VETNCHVLAAFTASSRDQILIFLVALEAAQRGLLGEA